MEFLFTGFIQIYSSSLYMGVFLTKLLQIFVESHTGHCFYRKFIPFSLFGNRKHYHKSKSSHTINLRCKYTVTYFTRNVICYVLFSVSFSRFDVDKFPSQYLFLGIRLRRNFGLLEDEAKENYYYLGKRQFWALLTTFIHNFTDIYHRDVSEPPACCKHRG